MSARAGEVDDVVRTVLRIWADDAAAHARALVRSDPTWGSEVVPLAGGWLVLSGNGMYVNRALGLGVDEDLGIDDIEVLVARSRALGLSPAVEVTPATTRRSVERLADRGFVHDVDDDVIALFRPIPGAPVQAPDDVEVRSVRSAADLALWQSTSALGWGHIDAEARRVSDAFTVAAHAVDGEGMVIAFDRASGEPIGCASVTINRGVATLGGMSTVPEHRGRGVQAALIRHRVDVAVATACDL
ncbi:MAG: GNAT family N-acetyltransferase, partial [Actinomycetota bacterium]